MGSNRSPRRALPIVVQHSFGRAGSGGPIGALERVLASDLSERYQWVRMHQDGSTGSVDIARIRAWAAMLRDVQPDLVHVRGLGNEGFHGVVAARLARCPRILVSVHGTVRDLTTPSLKQRALVGLFEPATLRLATHVTTVCEFASERDFIRRHAGKFVGPIVNGVDPIEVDVASRSRKRAELGIATDDVAVVSVGRLTFEKGHRDLAAAWRLLPDRLRQRAVLVVVGDGPEEIAVKQAYEAAGGRVFFLGRRHDVPEVLAGMDVFAFPSLHENLSNALLEAMAQGLPVVASRVGGNTEVVQRGGGLLVEAGDPVSLSASLVNLISDPDRRAALGLDAARVVHEHYSTDRMIDVLDQTYRAILEDGKS